MTRVMIVATVLVAMALPAVAQDTQGTISSNQHICRFAGDRFVSLRTPTPTFSSVQFRLGFSRAGWPEDYLAEQGCEDARKPQGFGCNPDFVMAVWTDGKSTPGRLQQPRQVVVDARHY